MTKETLKLKESTEAEVEAKLETNTGAPESPPQTEPAVAPHIDDEEMAKIEELNRLPVHALHTKLETDGIFAKSTDSRENLIKMITTGKSIHKLAAKSEAKRVYFLPDAILPDLEELKERGLTWTEDSESGSVTFTRDIAVTANMDQPAKHILKAARSAFAAARPVEVGHTKDLW